MCTLLRCTAVGSLQSPLSICCHPPSRMTSPQTPIWTWTMQSLSSSSSSRQTLVLLQVVSSRQNQQQQKSLLRSHPVSVPAAEAAPTAETGVEAAAAEAGAAAVGLAVANVGGGLASQRRGLKAEKNIRRSISTATRAASTSTVGTAETAGNGVSLSQVFVFGACRLFRCICGVEIGGYRLILWCHSVL